MVPTPSSNSGRPKRWSDGAIGPGITFATCSLIELVRGSAWFVPNPPAFLLLCVVFSAYRAGRAAGMVSAVIAWVYIAWFFSLPGQPFSYDRENLQRIAIWALMIPAMVELVGRLHARTLSVARSRLEASQELFRTFMDHAPVVTWIIDAAGRYVDASQSFCDLVDRRIDEIRGRTDEELWPGDPGRRRLGYQHDAMTSGRKHEVVEYVPDRSGALRTWFVARFPLRSPEGASWIGGAALDITEQRRLEEKVRAAQRLESIGRLAGFVAHDFNNLLTPILGHIEHFLMRLPADDPGRDGLLAARSAAECAAQLTRKLLAYGRKQMLDRRVCDLNSIVGDFEPVMRRLIGETTRIQLVLDASPVPIEADRTQIEQVLLNLVVNARDAMPTGGTLHIEIRRDDTARSSAASESLGAKRVGTAVLEISDTGTGIAAATLSRIFEPFFTTKGQDRGTGLGLAVVEGIVLQHRGTIQVESAEGQGTKFHIEFPLVSVTNVIAEPPVEHYVPSSRMQHVLVVEDDAAVRELVVYALETHGFGVVTATSGEEAVIVAADPQREIDLLLSDVMLPGISGPETADRIFALRPGLAVLFMSGYSPEELRVVYRGPLLEKPFTIGQLVSAMHHAMREHAAAP